MDSPDNLLTIICNNFRLSRERVKTKYVDKTIKKLSLSGLLNLQPKIYVLARIGLKKLTNLDNGKETTNTHEEFRKKSKILNRNFYQNNKVLFFNNSEIFFVLQNSLND